MENENLLHIRCTHTNENMNLLADWLLQNTYCYLICFETGKREEKRHFHSLVKPLNNTTLSTLRQQIHKKFSIKEKIEGYRAYKLTKIFERCHLSIAKLKKDKNTNLCYISKGESLGVFERYGGKVTFDETTAYNAQYWQNAGEIATAQSFGKMTFMENAKKQLQEKCKDEIFEIAKYWTRQSEEKMKTIQERDYVDNRHMIKAHKRMFSEFTKMLGQAVKKIDNQVGGMYAGIINSILTEKYTQNELRAYSDSLFDKLFGANSNSNLALI